MGRPGNHPVTDEQFQLHLEAVDLTTKLHLEIESFYLFGKILLDQLAHAVEYYFRPERDLSFDSHDQLEKNLGAFARAKGLSAPTERLTGLAATLKTEISNYRDYEIAHEKSPRTIKGTMFSANDPTATQILKTRLYPTERDVQTESTSLHRLSELLDGYVRGVLDWIVANREKSRLSLAEREATAEPR